MLKCVFVDENGIGSEMRYSVTENAPDVCGRRYGIIVEKAGGGGKTDVCEIRNRFFRREEAEQTAQLLCRHYVTPCTVREVIEDL